MKQTAVEWLENEICNIDEGIQLTKKSAHKILNLFKQAKAMEKEQMKDCYWYGDYDGRNGSDRNFEQYYNETFKPKQI